MGQQIAGDVEAVVAFGGALEFTAAQNLDAIATHDPGDAALTDLET